MNKKKKNIYKLKTINSYVCKTEILLNFDNKNNTDKNIFNCSSCKFHFFFLGGESTKPMLIGIVSVTLILPVMLYVLFLLKNHLIYKSKKWMRFTPKVLIVFAPSVPSHLNAVLALVEYLKTYCNVQPLIDELHIVTSKSRVSI